MDSEADSNSEIPTMHVTDPARGKRFHSIRKCMGESQSEFGARFGVTAMTISNYEKGRMPPSDVLEKLCGIGFSIDWLISGKGFLLKEDHFSEGFIQCCVGLLRQTDIGFEVVCDGTRVYANEALERITGYTADELVGEKLGFLSPTHEKKRMYQIYERILSGEEGIGHDSFTIRHKNGILINVLASYGLFQYNEKQAIIILMRDNRKNDQVEINLMNIQTILNDKQRNLMQLLNELVLNL